MGKPLETGMVMAFFVSACGSDGPEPVDPAPEVALDCEWIASDNCWRRALSDVAACIPQPDSGGMVVSGALSDDALTCDYGAETVVVFDVPVLGLPDPLGATATSDGAPCYRFESDTTAGFSMLLETKSGAATLVSEPSPVPGVFAMVATCPDGTRARTDDFVASMEACGLDSSRWPGSTTGQASATMVGLRLADGGGEETVLFECAMD